MSDSRQLSPQRGTEDSGPRETDMRLPGSVAEIMASPPGPRIGAFFDLDGTLVAGFTAVILTQERLLRRDMGVGSCWAWCRPASATPWAVSSSRT